MSRRVKIDFIDVSRAYFCASARRHVYIELPDGDAAIEAEGPVVRQEFFIEHYCVYNRRSVEWLIDRTGYECMGIYEVHEPADKYTIYAFLKGGV